MATFGSYGNLGGELVNIVEIDFNVSANSTVTAYTVPVGRYAFVVVRVAVAQSSNVIPIAGNSSIVFNYSPSNTSGYVATSGVSVSAFDDNKMMNEGESIVHSGTSATVNRRGNFLIFEYRKP